MPIGETRALKEHELELCRGFYASSGGMTRSMVEEFLAELRVEAPTDEELEALFEVPAAYGSKYIDYPSFVEFVDRQKQRHKTSRGMPDMDIIEAFVAMGGNPDQTGTVPTETVIEALQTFTLEIDMEALDSLGPELTFADLRRILQREPDPHLMSMVVPLLETSEGRTGEADQYTMKISDLIEMCHNLRVPMDAVKEFINGHDSIHLEGHRVRFADYWQLKSLNDFLDARKRTGRERKVSMKERSDSRKTSGIDILKMPVAAHRLRVNSTTSSIFKKENGRSKNFSFRNNRLTDELNDRESEGDSDVSASFVLSEAHSFRSHLVEHSVRDSIDSFREQSRHCSEAAEVAGSPGADLLPMVTDDARAGRKRKAAPEGESRKGKRQHASVPGHSAFRTYFSMDPTKAPPPPTHQNAAGREYQRLMIQSHREARDAWKSAPANAPPSDAFQLPKISPHQQEQAHVSAISGGWNPRKIPDPDPEDEVDSDDPDQPRPQRSMIMQDSLDMSSHALTAAASQPNKKSRRGTSHNESSEQEEWNPFQGMDNCSLIEFILTNPNGLKGIVSRPRKKHPTQSEPRLEIEQKADGASDSGETRMAKSLPQQQGHAPRPPTHQRAATSQKPSTHQRRRRVPPGPLEVNPFPYRKNLRGDRVPWDGNENPIHRDIIWDSLGRKVSPKSTSGAEEGEDKADVFKRPKNAFIEPTKPRPPKTAPSGRLESKQRWRRPRVGEKAEGKAMREAKSECSPRKLSPQKQAETKETKGEALQGEDEKIASKGEEPKKSPQKKQPKPEPQPMQAAQTQTDCAIQAKPDTKVVMLPKKELTQLRAKLKSEREARQEARHKAIQAEHEANRSLHQSKEDSPKRRLKGPVVPHTPTAQKEGGRKSFRRGLNRSTDCNENDKVGLSPKPSPKVCSKEDFVADQKANEAAILIQKVWRGCLGRNKALARRMSLEDRLEAEERLRKDNAARVIQLGYRRHLKHPLPASNSPCGLLTEVYIRKGTSLKGWVILSQAVKTMFGKPSETLKKAEERREDEDGMERRDEEAETGDDELCGERRDEAEDGMERRDEEYGERRDEIEDSMESKEEEKSEGMERRDEGEDDGETREDHQAQAMKGSVQNSDVDVTLCAQIVIHGQDLGHEYPGLQLIIKALKVSKVIPSSADILQELPNLASNDANQGLLILRRASLHKNEVPSEVSALNRMFKLANDDCEGLAALQAASSKTKELSESPNLAALGLTLQTSLECADGKSFQGLSLLGAAMASPKAKKTRA